MEYAVSVCCITYNQEAYIGRCLERIFEQETSFPFEVIVHDDRSTDRTVAIIKEFQTRYGSRLRLYTETENQYSQGKKIFGDVTLPFARGRYIATCEGDDFWCDRHKLQRQFDAMEAAPDAAWCAHYVQWVTEDGTAEDGRTYPRTALCAGSQPVSFTTEQILELFLQEGFQLSSYFIRASALDEYIHRMPEFAKAAPVEDEALVRYLAAQGDTVFLPQIMSCYRQNAVGSWTSDHMAQRNKAIRHFNLLDRMLEQYNSYTGGRYAELIGQDRLQKQWNMYLTQGNYRNLLKKPYRAFLQKLSLRSRIGILLRAVLQKE
jgi:glycosyltransferase involved in cell wall biosynthesis